MEETLEDFRNWWVDNRVINTPSNGLLNVNTLNHTGEVRSVILFREGCWQVELITMPPDSELEPHIHPDADSYEIYITGDIEFTKDGVIYKQIELGNHLSVPHDSWHSVKMGSTGGCFLSVQKWLNNVAPRFLGNTWRSATVQ